MILPPSRPAETRRDNEFCRLEEVVDAVYQGIRTSDSKNKIPCAEDVAMPGLRAMSTSCQCARVNMSMSQQVFESHPL